MNLFLLTIILYAIVITHIAFGQVKGKSHGSDGERNPILSGEVLDREDSSKKNSVRRRPSSRRRSSSSSSGNEANNHNEASIRRSSSCNRYSGFDIRPYLSRNRYSNYIYLRIWGGCDYRCFCQNNFKLFLRNMVFQMNIIRQSHRVRCLKRVQDLDIRAQHLASMMARESKIIRDYTTEYGVCISVVDNPLSSLIVTKWHDERSEYYYTFGHGSPYTYKFTQLVWKNTEFVGVGAATNGSHVFVAAYFYPRGNIRGKFRKNVFRQDTKLLKKII
uniref:SCP domain-containing protein n=1 Tax=Strongyloides papillosus TaxID=174720 RepID=A0A0N5BVV4_STREA